MNKKDKLTKQDALKKICLWACVYYTATTFLLIFLFWLISNDITRAMHPVALMLVLPFSLFFATANYICKETKLGTAAKVFLHYALTLGGIWLFLFLPNKSEGQSASGAFLLFLLLTVIYALIMGVVLYMRARIGRIARDSAAYTGVYKNK